MGAQWWAHLPIADLVRPSVPSLSLSLSLCSSLPLVSLQAFDATLIGVALAILVVLATVYLKFVPGPSNRRGGNDPITPTGSSGASRSPFVPSIFNRVHNRPIWVWPHGPQERVGVGRAPFPIAPRAPSSPGGLLPAAGHLEHHHPPARSGNTD